MLLLFDIDGTLIRCGGAGRRALDRAFLALYGIERALERVRLDGSTDPVIVQAAFQHQLGRLPRDGEQETLIASYLELLEEELAASAERYMVLRGARALLDVLAAEQRFVFGLATGNVERGARLKLQPAGLNAYFSFGGFGCDAAVRAELVARGIERGQALAEARLGRRFGPGEIVVFGDTANDITAAHLAGALGVGVLEGSGVPEELAASGPDLLVDSFADPRLASLLGVSLEAAVP